MPILPGEPDIYPQELFDRLGQIEAESTQWWAMYTLARREKELMRRLRALDIAFYSPLVHKRTRSPGRPGARELRAAVCQLCVCLWQRAAATSGADDQLYFPHSERARSVPNWCTTCGRFGG